MKCNKNVATSVQVWISTEVSFHIVSLLIKCSSSILVVSVLYPVRRFAKSLTFNGIKCFSFLIFLSFAFLSLLFTDQKHDMYVWMDGYVTVSGYLFLALTLERLSVLLLSASVFFKLVCGVNYLSELCFLLKRWSKTPVQAE